MSSLTKAYGVSLTGKSDRSRRIGDELSRKVYDLDIEAVSAEKNYTDVKAVTEDTNAKADEEYIQTKAKAREAKDEAEEEYKLTNAKAEELYKQTKANADETKADAVEEYKRVKANAKAKLEETKAKTAAECVLARRAKVLAATNLEEARVELVAAATIYLRYAVWLDERIALTQCTNTRCMTHI